MNTTQVRQRLARTAAPLYRRPQPGARMRPGYLVVGTKRGGSTSLADWIVGHPEVAPCLAAKGTHYFDENFQRGEGWYFTRFVAPASRWRITGEASPYYMFHPLAPARIAKALPEVKLIAVLRDPVERAWSHFRYETQHGRETETFARALDLEPQRIAGERERIAADPGYEGFEYRYHAYLERGHYAEQIRELHRHVASERILLVQSEEMFSDPHTTLGRVWDFLGLPDHLPPDLAAQNAGVSRGDIPAPERQRLQEYYAPLNEELYALPGVDFRWEDPA